jgi:hypothetical protein
MGAFPFTYLGLPLRITKPRLDDFLPMVHKVEKRLTCTSLFLSQAGKLEMVNSVLSALPTYYMCTLKLPPTVIKQIDKYQKHCVWRGGDINAKKPPLEAWHMVTRPKSEGGLGVINLSTQNDVLLLKSLHKFYNHQDLPWVHLIWDNHYANGCLPDLKKKGSFWWRALLKLLDTYKGIVAVKLGNGQTALLWHDLWNGAVSHLSFPELFSFTKCPSLIIQQAKQLDPLHQIFHLPFSEEAFHQLLGLQSLIESLLLTDQLDTWGYIWGQDTFSSRKAYKNLIGHGQLHTVYRWTWASKCQPKHKVFFWLLLKDHLNTRSML